MSESANVKASDGTTGAAITDTDTKELWVTLDDTRPSASTSETDGATKLTAYKLTDTTDRNINNVIITNTLTDVPLTGIRETDRDWTILILLTCTALAMVATLTILRRMRA